jgi:DNA-binding protein HU-beta
MLDLGRHTESHVRTFNTDRQEVAVATMTKQELLESIAGSAGVSRSQAESVLSQFFSTVTEAAKRGDSTRWPGFGTFAAVQRGARTGRNPRTGEPVKIAASKALKFSPSATLRQEMNAKKSAKKAAASAKATKGTAKKATGTAKAAKTTAKKATGTAKATKGTAKKASAAKKR